MSVKWIICPQKNQKTVQFPRIASWCVTCTIGTRWCDRSNLSYWQAWLTWSCNDVLKGSQWCHCRWSIPMLLLIVFFFRRNNTSTVNCWHSARICGYNCLVVCFFWCCADYLSFVSVCWIQCGHCWSMCPSLLPHPMWCAKTDLPIIQAKVLEIYWV
jgi:hypothetical protein